MECTTPLLGQIEFPIQQEMVLGTRIGQKHPNLAVFHAAGGPAILARHARRLLAFFDEARLIDDQHGLQSPEMLNNIGAQSIAEGIGIPDRPPQQVLDAVRGGFAIAFGELPAVFSL